MAKAVCIIILLVSFTLLSPAIASRHHRRLSTGKAGAESPVDDDLESCDVQCKLIPASAESKETLDLGHGPVEFFCDCY